MRPCSRWIADIAALALSVGLLPAQVQWVNAGTCPVPGWPAAYDSGRDRIVAYAGQTWEYDGARWQQMLPAQSPTGSTGVGSMGYDPMRRRTVAYLASVTETWEWDGVNWSLAATAGPSVAPASLVYHPGRGTLVFFGGLVGLNDLWEWDGLAWQQIPAANPPPVGSLTLFNTLAYDASRDRLVVFGATVGGGPPPGGTALAVTFEWDAQNGWQQFNSGGPAALYRRLLFDHSRRTQVLVVTNSHLQPLEAWERIGTGTWINRGPSGAPTFGQVLGSLSYDSRRGRCVTNNGDGTTWVYEPLNRARYELHASGCPGSFGPPTLWLAAPWTLPWLGDTFISRLDNLPLSIGVLAMGFQTSTWGSIRLPYDLAPLGMPGCHLWIAPEAVLFGAGSGGSLQVPIALPQQASLLGLRFYQQGVALDPGANAAGWTVSNSTWGLTGAR